MIRRIMLLVFTATIAVSAEKIKIPREPFKSRLDNPYYRGILERSAKTPSWVNTAALKYLTSRIGIAVPETLRVLVLRVEFPEDDDSTTWGNGKMDLKGFGTPSDGLSYDPPHDRNYFENQMLGLRNFYLLNSRGKLVIEYDVYPKEPFRCYQVSHQMAFYGDSSNPDRGITLLMRDALLAAAKDPEIDFSRYHYTYAGRSFDMVVVFHAGSTLQTSAAYGYTSDVASATVTPGALDAYTGRDFVEAGGVPISSASILPESPRVEGAMYGLPGLLYHEFGHLLGALDLYDVTYYTQGVGAWSLMGSGGWLSYPPGQIPSMHDAFHRYIWGWDSAVVVARDTTISLYAAEFDTLAIPERTGVEHPTLVKIPIREGEYFLIENRQVDILAKDTVEVDVKDGVPIWVVNGEYDSYQPGSGIIIWHVDEDVVEEWGDYNRINSWTRYASYGQHNAVDMEEADGIQDYEILYLSTQAYASQGSVFDPFFSGGNTDFGISTNPSSDGYYGETGINVEVLDPSDTVMRVKITFGDNLKGFPQTAENLNEVNFINAMDIDGNGTKELVAFGSGPDGEGRIGYAWRANGQPYASTSQFLTFNFGSLSSSPAFGDVDGDGVVEAVLLGTTGRISVFDTDSLINGSQAAPKSGFPFDLSGRSFTAPMLADIDGDGILDIVSVNEFGKVYALKVESDTVSIISGFPLDLGEEVRAGFALVQTSPLRIAVIASSGNLYVFDRSGKTVKGFPVALGKASAQCDVPPVVCDIDGDSKREIVVFAYEYSSYRYFAVDLDGVVKYKSTRTFPPPLTAPAVADMNSDGLPEVVFGSLNGIWALEANGAALDGYPLVFPETYDRLVWIPHEGYLYPFTFPYTFSFRTSPAVADIDSDGKMEIVVGSPDHGVYLLKSGNSKPYKTLYTKLGVGRAVSVADLDGNGKLDILVGADSGFVNVWRTSGSKALWSSWMHDPANTGLVTESFTSPSAPSQPLTGVYVYPNPAANHAYLRATIGDVDDLKIQIIDIAGKIQASLEPDFQPGMINDIPLDQVLAELVSGLYIVRVEAVKSGLKTVELYKLGIAR